jgi:hypothetical protein
MRANCVVLNASLSKADVMLQKHLPIGRSFARGDERVILPHLGVVPIIVGETERQIDRDGAERSPYINGGTARVDLDLSEAPTIEIRDVGQ